jgi:hypothetical protein
VAPVVEARGYEAVRSDHMTRPGLITSQVLQEVAEAALVVADLTGHNPNVFYELAIRHATRQPIVQLISSEDELPFDIAAMRTIVFDIHDLDSVEEARKDLDGHISASRRTQARSRPRFRPRLESLLYGKVMNR